MHDVKMSTLLDGLPNKFVKSPFFKNLYDSFLNNGP